VLRAGTIDEAMHDAAKDFQADFIVANLDPLRALPILPTRRRGRRVYGYALESKAPAVRLYDKVACRPATSSIARTFEA
jgi:hypothetical protein